MATIFPASAITPSATPIGSPAIACHSPRCRSVGSFAASAPDLIISTGAAPGLIALLLGKLVFRRRTIWIDSMANADRLSTSGRLAGRLADLWLTQWPHLAEAGGPQFWGPVL
jgi:hypothetical protein